MIRAKYSLAFSVWCVGLTASLLLGLKSALADDDLTLKRILHQAQSEAEISAAKTLIETLSGGAQEVEPEPFEALSEGQRPQDIAAETQSKSFAQPTASTADEASQANKETLGAAPSNGAIPGEEHARNRSADILDTAAAPILQPHGAADVEAGTSDPSAVTVLSTPNDKYAEPQRGSGETVYSDSVTRPSASTAQVSVQSEEPASAAEPEVPQRDTNELKPSEAISSSEAVVPRGGGTDPSAAIVSVPSGRAERETANISTEVEADGTRPSTVHEEDGKEVAAVSDVTAQALPFNDFAPLPASIRNLTPDEALARAAEQQIPSVNIEVYFQRGRANLSEGTFLLLGAVGRALSDPQLKNTSFMIAGHSDAKGRRETNLVLSTQRAQAVRQFLIRNFDIDPDRLVAKGFGEDHPKDPRKPYADINRRVQIINLPDEVEAGR